ncbi:galactose-1-phosphate uridylyltransferase [Janthinobacterium fluminis]|uniref:Galactose-1-phosphate uridylyltransferase n=1 Tax=Janthinobacterium fluminis TaxID=2987524 RepID=A0ABT5JXA4_9BURK|nr:galactose-1-phosphate uridylyltransferase [Janthinobacterium fluminis]MDC8757353.1 galactose-1-phosphate uridylyltransferase [Janthinobacterium fluminis]
MHCQELFKPDGRQLTLYSRAPITALAAAPSPFAEPLGANPHLRWHPLRGEWVTYAPYRQERTFLPPPQYNPLAATLDPLYPTELPRGDYDVAVFDNRFPALALEARAPPPLIVPTAAARGHCEVVVFTQDARASLGALGLEHIELLLQVWAARTARLAARAPVAYVLPFENRGAEVGVTLHHPHGQIYAYPFVPPVPRRMLEQERAFYEENGTALLVDLAQREVASGARLLYRGQHAVAFVPVCARYPYEVWVTPLAQVGQFAALTPPQRADLARALKTVLLKYEGLWQRPFPYLMAWYQAPTDGQPHPETQLHAQFLPPYRTRERLKYLAGTELAAGLFAMDALPEDKARELQQVAVSLEPP